jgi:hypothetical protein
MTYQTNSNKLVAFKLQDTKGTPATGADGTVLVDAGGQGIDISKAVVASKQRRRDGMVTRGRHGSQRTSAAYDHELTVDGLLEILEAISRDTWEAADVVLTEADFTSITTEANAIVFASGDPRALEIASGDVVVLDTHTSAANNGKNLRVTSVSATKVFVAETLVVNAVADTDCGLTRKRKLVQYAGGSLLRRYFTLEEVDLDLDKSKVVSDFVWTQAKLSMAADETIMATVSGMGTGQVDQFTGGACPSLTSPVESTSLGLAVVDATLRVKGSDVVDLVGFDFTWDIQGAAPSTFGSAAQKYSPDVFTGNSQVGLNITMLKDDHQQLTDFLAETQYELHVLMVENESEPKSFLSLYVGNFTLGSVKDSPASNTGGGATVTISIPPALVGKDTRGAGYDATMVKFATSVPA